MTVCSAGSCHILTCMQVQQCMHAMHSAREVRSNAMVTSCKPYHCAASNHVLLSATQVSSFLHAQARHFGFLLRGLQEIEGALQGRNIPFFLLRVSSVHYCQAGEKQLLLSSQICRGKLPESCAVSCLCRCTVQGCWSAVHSQLLCTVIQSCDAF